LVVFALGARLVAVLALGFAAAVFLVAAGFLALVALAAALGFVAVLALVTLGLVSVFSFCYRVSGRWTSIGNVLQLTLGAATFFSAGLASFLASLTGPEGPATKSMDWFTCDRIASAYPWAV
jgi:hypothetical protein